MPATQKRFSWTEHRSLYEELADIKHRVVERSKSGGTKDNQVPLINNVRQLTDDIKKYMDAKNANVKRLCEKLEELSGRETKSNPEEHEGCYACVGATLWPKANPDLDEQKRIMASLCDELGVFLERDPSTKWYMWIFETWSSVFRIRQAFFLMSAFALMLSLSTGLMMEQFFTILGSNFMKLNGGNGFYTEWSGIFWRYFVVWWLPFGMLIMAMLGDKMCNLVMDSLDFPALHVFRASQVAATKRWRDDDLDLNRLKVVDRFNIFLFECLPHVVVVVAFCWRTKDWTLVGIVTLYLEGYLLGSLITSLVCLAIFVLCEVRIAIAASRGNVRIVKLKNIIAAKIDHKKMRPYDLYIGFERLQRELQEEESQDASSNSPKWKSFPGVGQPDSALSGRARRGSDPIPGKGLEPSETFRTSWTIWVKRRVYRRVYRIRYACLVVIIWTLMVLSYYSGLYSFFAGPHDIHWLDPLILAVVLVVTVATCVYTLRANFRRVVGAPFTIILIANVVLGVILTCSSSVHIRNDVSMKAIMNVTNMPAGNSGLQAWRGVTPGQPRPYPICNMTWGSPGAPLRALDLANLAWIVYDSADDLGHMQEMLDSSFEPERHARLVHVNKYKSLPRWGHFYFPVAASPKLNARGGTRVIAVKGTSTFLDALLDTNMFATVKLLQFFGTLLPVLQILPRPFIQWMLYFIHLHTTFHAERNVWEGLWQNVTELMQDHPEDTFVMTGHSLGGVLAQIIAAHLNISAIVWSAPGMAYSADLFKVPVQAVKRSVVSVVPDHDVVPHVDLQAGTLQRIECRDKNGDEDSPLRCHSLVKTACEVWRVCGDDRDFAESCSEHVNPANLGRLFVKDDYIGN